MRNAWGGGIQAYTRCSSRNPVMHGKSTAKPVGNAFFIGAGTKSLSELHSYIVTSWIQRSAKPKLV